MIVEELLLRDRKRMAARVLRGRGAAKKHLDMLAIEGAIITIDAMGCQREIAKKIVDHCPRCRSPLKIFKVGGRTAYCCPHCQS